jgi:hypothetical protein
MHIELRAFVRNAHRWVLAVTAAVFLLPQVAAAANKTPTISGTPATTATVGQPYSFTPKASDPEGKTLRFDIANKPSWASFSYSTGKLSGTPTSAGTSGAIQIFVWDGVNTNYLPKFTITVKSSGSSSSNRAPTISGTPPTTGTVGVSYSFKPAAADADGNTLGFSIANRPSWATFSTSTGQLSGKPASSNVGTFSNIVITVSDGKVATSLKAFSIAVKAASGSSGSNTAPVISGSPLTSVKAGIGYTFTPTASDANNDTLTFSISNKPSWASFSTSSGKLSGTPTAAQVGSYSNIVISVSDGKVKTSLKAFAVNVTATASGAATLSWTPPTSNTDGSSLTNLSGYRIYYGTSSSSLTQTVQINNPGISTYMVESLSSGTTYYFGVKAITSKGAESALSNVASKKVN